VANSGEDRQLDWKLRESFRVGPAMDGPEAFFRVFPWTITTDRVGRVYVLDVGDHRVSVFGPGGRHLRDLGRRGGGPGEFLRPVGLAVGDDGVITVADEGKLGTVRFDSAGAVLEQQRLNMRLGPIGLTRRGLLVAQGNGPDLYRLVLIAEHDTTVLAEAPEPGIVRFRNCPMAVPGRPFFAQRIRWASRDDLIIVNDTTAYELSVYSGVEEVARISRAIPVVEIDERAALANSSVRGGFEIIWGSNKCKISPEELLDAQGFARRMSPVVDVAIAPSGEVWVRYLREFDGRSRIDVFSAAGHYVGTLPADTRFPTAFQSSDHFVVLQWDPDGVPLVVGYELLRNGS
jgi:hypothetical protein